MIRPGTEEAELYPGQNNSIQVKIKTTGFIYLHFNPNIMKIYDSSQKYTSHKTGFFFLVFGLCILNSCVTTRKTTYLQEYRKSEIPSEYTAPETYLIQPSDNLYIRVSTPDPRLSAIFNAMPVGGTMTMSEESSALLSYSVQLDGSVELPYIGSIDVVGKTLSEAKDAIEVVLVDYVSDAAITVKLVNNYVSILGEVNAPGLYPIYKDRLNIYQALSMAGDMAEYSDRFRVSIVRQTTEGSIVKEFDLTDKNIIDSEFYYIMPNDVIYAKPMKGKFFAMNQFPFTLIFASITTFLLLHSYLQ